MLFKYWLEAYEKYKDKIELSAVGRTFPFAHWFPTGQTRVYIPLKSENDAVSNDNIDSIQGLLKDFKGGGKFQQSPEGYVLIDYKKGFVAPKNNPKRIYKFIPILLHVQQTTSETLNKLYSYGELSELKYNYELRSFNKYYSEIKNDFENSPLRRLKSPYVVAISYDIHDIGKMSTDRNWTSCMNLDSGSNKREVYCEVKNGGFVAYLINENDLEIKKPLARIHIRRFSNKKRSVAVPEDVVYGNDIPGFMETVKKWINQRQGRFSGEFIMKGGSYSDTFSKKHIFEPIKEKSLLKWLEKYNNLESYKKPAYNKFLIKSISGLIHLPNLSDNAKQILNNQFKNLMAGPHKEDFVIKDYHKQFLSKYPEFAKEDHIKNWNGYRISNALKNLPPEKHEEIKNLVHDNAMSKLVYPPINEIDGSEYKLLGYYQDILSQLEIFNPISPNLTKKILDFQNVILKDNDFPKKILTDVSEAIFNTLAMTKTDNPYAIEIYKNHLNNLNEFDLFKYPSLVRAFINLGENGKIFLPQLKKELEETKNSKISVRELDEFRKKRKIEIYNYVIDSIESGKPSNKYTPWL